MKKDGSILPYPCRCGDEFLTDEVWQEVEDNAMSLVSLVPTGKRKIEIEVAG